MSYYVCKGAKLKCSMGSDQSDLEVVHLERPVKLCGQPMAGIMDHKPMMNIKPFGQCKSLANPTVASATAANYGRLQEMPCIPNTLSPWVNCKINFLVKGQPALLDCSKCMCLWAGVIEITDPGQKLMSCGSSGLGSQDMGAPAGAQNLAATPGNGLALHGAGIGLAAVAGSAVSQGTASQASPSSLVSQNTGAASSESTAAEPKVAEIYWSYGKDHKRLSGKSRFYVDLNLHVKTENYNDGDTVNITIKRKDGQLLFGTTQTLNLRGTVSGNEAVFENVLKEYTLNLNTYEKETDVADETLSKRPRWKDVYDGYPLVNRGTSNENDLPAEQVFKSILEDNSENRSMFNNFSSNAGTTRLSIALIRAGMTLRKDFRVQIGDLKGKGFISSAINLIKWLSEPEQFGAADIIIKNPSSLADVRSKIGNKRGIYAFESNDYKRASGLTTLWYNGDAIGGNNCYDLAKEIHFWELK